MKRKEIIVALFLGTIIALTGCDNKNSQNNETENITIKYTISFNTNDENTFLLECENNSKIVKPNDPVKNGYKFDGWYFDISFTNKVDFDSYYVNESKIIYAKWIKIPNDTPKDDNPSNPDTPKDDNPSNPDTPKDDNPSTPNLEEYRSLKIGELETYATEYISAYESLSQSISEKRDNGIDLINSATSANSIDNILDNCKNEITVIVNNYLVENSSIEVTKYSGYLETAYLEWKKVVGAEKYNVYYKKSDSSSYVQIDKSLIREYPDNYRADILGLKEGNYSIMVKAVVDGVECENGASREVNVLKQDRTGFAFSSLSPLNGGAVGAYNLDGTLKANAIVLYVSEENKNDISCEIISDKKGNKTSAVGIGNITALYSKGFENRPLDIRIIGKVTQSGLTNSNDNLNLGIKEAYKNCPNDIINAGITIEGVGEDATLFGVGVRMMKTNNVEIKNLGLIDWPDDGIASQGTVNLWIHNCDVFYGHPGSAADQVKGDGSCDVKDNTNFVTISYMHFWDSGKMSLCGMKSEKEDNYITYHHNWFDHSDSRHPRVRTMSVHVYNNYFDGNAKYGVGATLGSNIFVEGNYFRNCKNPMLSSKQGSDALGEGTFSGENGGMIKAFNNHIEGATSLVYANAGIGTQGATLALNQVSFDAYLASTRGEVISDSFKTVAGGKAYSNFDTKVDLGVSEDMIDSPKTAQTRVMQYAGRINGGDIKWSFNNSVDDTSYTIDKNLQALVLSYQSKLISIQK